MASQKTAVQFINIPCYPYDPFHFSLLTLPYCFLCFEFFLSFEIDKSDLFLLQISLSMCISSDRELL